MNRVARMVVRAGMGLAQALQVVVMRSYTEDEVKIAVLNAFIEHLIEKINCLERQIENQRTPEEPPGQQIGSDRLLN